jgi:argininosuccinate lyase
LRSLNPAFDQDFYSCLTLDSVLAIHDLPGGTAAAQVRQAIAKAKARIESILEESHAHA